MEHTEITPTELIHKIYNRSDRFTISDTFPSGYIVWNIGRSNFPFEGFVPLAKPDPTMPYHIILKDLVAWRVKDEETALRIIEQAHHEEINFSNHHRYE